MKFGLAAKLGSKSTFRKLITSYILLTSIILLVSTSILYYGYKAEITEQANTVSRQMLNQANYYTDNTVKWAKSFIYQLYLDEDISKLMFEANPDNSQNVLIGTMKIHQAAALVPLISSICVYNHNNGRFYSSLEDAAHQSFVADQDTIKLLRENNQTFSIKFIPRQIDSNAYGNQHRKNVLTIILSNVKSSRDNMPEGAIILNLDADSVENYFKNNISGENNLLAISDSGKIIFNANPKLYLTDVSGHSYIKQIMSSKKNEGNFALDIAGKPALINYFKSQRLGLIFINITSYDTLLGTINKMIRLILLVVILTLVIGIFFAVYWSGHIYRPINKAVNYLKNITPLESGHNELDYLVLAVDKILNTPSSLKDLSFEDLNLVKEKLLQGILLDTVDDYDKLQEKIAELQLKISSGQKFKVVIFKLDNFKALKQNYQWGNLNQLKVDLQTIVKSRTELEYELLQFEDGELVLIVSFDPDSLNLRKCHASIIEFINGVQNEVQQKLGITLSAGTGDCVDDFAEISRSYKIARECLNYRYKYGSQAIIAYETILAQFQKDYRYDENLENNIYSALKLGNFPKVEAELDKLLAEIVNFSYHDLNVALTQLALNSKKLIYSLYKLNNKKIYIDIPEFKNIIENLENMDEVKQWFLELYKNTIESLKEKKVNRKKDLIDGVIKYIEENYQNPLLSLESIAEELNISPNYLRLKFKEAESKSLSNYINEIRFAKAKQLLETRNLTVKEIAARVGFNNYNYFYTAFKKYYGISPNQFRANLDSTSQ